MRPAVKARTPVLDACERWYSAAYLLETVPAALLILAMHGHDPEGSIVRAVNDTRDNDTVAAIVGAAVGALHGEGKLPERWRDNLLGRTRSHDDGHLFELLDEALRGVSSNTLSAHYRYPVPRTTGRLDWESRIVSVTTLTVRVGLY